MDEDDDEEDDEDDEEASPVPAAAAIYGTCTCVRKKRHVTWNGERIVMSVDRRVRDDILACCFVNDDPLKIMLRRKKQKFRIYGNTQHKVRRLLKIWDPHRDKKASSQIECCRNCETSDLPALDYF